MRIAAVDFTKTREIEFGGRRRKTYLKAARKKIRKIKSIGNQKIFLNKEKALSFVIANISPGDTVICDDSLFGYFQKRLPRFGVNVVKESAVKRMSDYRALCNLVDTLLRLEIEKYKRKGP